MREAHACKGKALDCFPKGNHVVLKLVTILVNLKQTKKWVCFRFTKIVTSKSLKVVTKILKSSHCLSLY